MCDWRNRLVLDVSMFAVMHVCSHACMCQCVELSMYKCRACIIVHAPAHCTCASFGKDGTNTRPRTTCMNMTSRMCMHQLMLRVHCSSEFRRGSRTTTLMRERARTFYASSAPPQRLWFGGPFRSKFFSAYGSARGSAPARALGPPSATLVRARRSSRGPRAHRARA